MTNDTAQDIINALDDILDREREALLKGELDMIARLLEEKESMFDRLQDISVETPAPLENLQGKVRRNQALLDGALRGINSVAERMSTLRKVRKTLETYDSSGRKTSIQSAPTNKVEKRA